MHSTRHNYAVLNVGLDWLVGSLVLDEAFKEDEDLGIDVGGLGSLATITLGMQYVPKTSKPEVWALSRGVVSVLLRVFIVCIMIAGWKEV